MGIKDKVYLPPILDGFNGEIIFYDVSKVANLSQTIHMLEQLNQYPNFDFT